MTENQKKSDRQYAAYMARKYFSGQISKHEILDSFPNYENDFKMRLLYNRIMKKPKTGWLFGTSKEAHEKYLTETYEIIDDLETGRMRLRTMKRLLEELWLQSNDCSEPIKNMWFPIQEVAKSTSNSREEIRRYLNLLVDKGIIIRTSDEPLLYEFTEIGKELKADSEIEKIIKNVA
jgi:predicted transcriptional regulator